MANEAIVTVLEIDAAPATKGEVEYSRAMDSAEKSAGKVIDKQQELSLAIAGVTPAIIASVQGFNQMDRATQQMIAANENHARSHGLVNAAVRTSIKSAIDYTASTLATAGAVGAGVLAFGGLLAILGPIVLAYKVVKEAIDLVTEAWDLGGKKLDEYRSIAEQAAKVDLSTTYFQSLKKGAEDSKVSVDDLTKSMQTLQKQSSERLGGAPLDNRLDAHLKAGNLDGNGGLDQYRQANTTEERYKAIVSLIDQAMDAGKRLAALDIAGTAFGPEAAENLRKDSEYFDKINAAAAKVSSTQIVSPEDIGRALDLQNRYDAAVKILETRWHPIQDLLTQAGIEFRSNWVSTVETIAAGVDWATKLVMKLGDVPSWFQKKLNEGSQWVIDNTTSPESRASAEKSYGIGSDPAEMARGTEAYTAAVGRLRAGLQDQAAQQRKVAEANSISQKVMGDTSNTLDDQTKGAVAQADAYTRALESVTKHTARLQADTLAVGLGAGAQEEYRARSQLTIAAQLAGRAPTAALTEEIERQAKAAGAAGKSLALLRVQDQVDFQTKTLFMSSSDQGIAATMKNLYGSEWQSHMDDALAKQMRMNDVMKELKGTASGFLSDFVGGLMQGKDVMAPITGSLSNLAKRLAEHANKEAEERRADDDREAA